MGRMNVDPMVTFSDGTRLLISTQSSREGSFTCELFVAKPDLADHLDLRAVSHPVEGQTCLDAQEGAYRSATRLYPDTADHIKRPPYLIWHGPTHYS